MKSLVESLLGMAGKIKEMNSKKEKKYEFNILNCSSAGFPDF